MASSVIVELWERFLDLRCDGFECVLLLVFAGVMFVGGWYVIPFGAQILRNAWRRER